MTALPKFVTHSPPLHDPVCFLNSSCHNLYYLGLLKIFLLPGFLSPHFSYFVMKQSTPKLSDINHHLYNCSKLTRLPIWSKLSWIILLLGPDLFDLGQASHASTVSFWVSKAWLVYKSLQWEGGHWAFVSKCSLVLQQISTGLCM